MKKILVLAYQVSPTKGSEFSVAWNYILHMSKNNHLVVLYGVSDEHLGEMSEMQEYLKRDTISNVKFVGVETNKKIEIFNFLNRKGIFNYSFYLAFNEWQKLAFKKAKEVIEEEDIDVVHYLGPIGYREPGYLWKLNLPYIWGPVGGTYSVPASLMKAVDASGKLKLGFRKVANWIQLNYKKSLKKAIESTDVLLAATTYDQRKLVEKFDKKVYYLPENGITQDLIHPSVNYFSEKLNIIWIGRIDANKALILLLVALTKVKNQNISLEVLGTGNLKEQMQKFADVNNINHMINWHGSVPRDQVMKLLSSAHLHVLTSLTEANTTVIWEAMASGVPSMALDHCGMHDIICENCGIKIPIDSYENVVNGIAEKLDFYNDNRNELEKLSKGVAVCARKYRWSERIKFWEDMYDLAIENHAGKNKHSYMH